jgi:hypothetical protein
VNLTDQQKGLLRLLVSNDESNAGAEFLFTRSMTGAGLSYPKGVSVPVVCDDTDLYQLKRENLINLTPVARNVHRGKPTQLGITTVRGFTVSDDEPLQQAMSLRKMGTPRLDLQPMAGSSEPLAQTSVGTCGEPTIDSHARSTDHLPRSAKRLMEEYESQCGLLGLEARERLKKHGEQGETHLNRQIEVAARRIGERREAIEHATDDNEQEAAEVALRLETTTLRQEVIGLAETVAGNAVRAFANGVLASQGRLGVHADLLREYTARLASEIRDRLSASAVFREGPLLPWRQDPVTQKAIQVCEETIVERGKVGDEWPYGGQGFDGRDLTWCAVVQEWEASKGAEKNNPGQRERIPESALRSILSSHFGVRPKDVTWEQIQRAGADLCRHYGPVLVVPLELEAGNPPKPAPVSIGTAQFWKEREDEFRKHDTPESNLLAVWNSLDDQWFFRPGSGVKSTTPGAEQVFKSLARVAAKGFAGSRSTEPWVDWLNALRRAPNPSTGKSLYSKISSTGSYTTSERELARMAQSRESIPPSGVWEFVVSSGGNGDADQSKASEVSDSGAAEKRMFWETTTEAIECVFTSSANFCLELRSRTSNRKKRVSGKRRDAGTARIRQANVYKTALAGNVDRLRKECGWSFGDFAKAADLDKKLILGHVNKGKGATPRTLETYARTFTEKLGRPVTVAELECPPK